MEKEPAKIGAVVLAGDRRASKLINHKNKAFLTLKDVPLFIHVLRAIARSKHVGRTVVVGPKGQLNKALETADLDDDFLNNVETVEQEKNILENVKSGFVALLDGVKPGTPLERLKGSEYSNIPALYLSCDIPLVTPYEIDEFVESADMQQYDFVSGLTREPVMEYYYPSPESPGIRMNYYHIREGLCRHNNLHIGKPLKVERLWYVERMYELRYQTKLLNIIASVFHTLFSGRKVLSTLSYFISMQIARSLSGKGIPKLYEAFRRRNSQEGVERCMSAIMGMNMQFAYTSYGGAVLDVDNAQGLEVAVKMYDRWMVHQDEINKKIITGSKHGDG